MFDNNHKIEFKFCFVYRLDHLSSASQEKSRMNANTGHYSGSSNSQHDLQQNVPASESQRHRISSLLPKVKVSYSKFFCQYLTQKIERWD